MNRWKLRSGVISLICLLITLEASPLTRPLVGESPLRETKRGETSVHLPAGAGKDLIVQKCSNCHALDRVVKEHRTESEWRDLLRIMAAQGLKLNDKENEMVLRYLIKYLGKPEGAKPSAGSGT